MKSIAVVSPHLASIKSPSTQAFEVSLNSLFNFFIALIDEKDFSLSDLDKESVLVKKESFSLNFRDRVIISNLHKYFERVPDSLSHGAIGSEFMGVVQGVGSAVTNLKAGDRVIPNAEFPYNSVLGAPGGIPTNLSSRQLEVLHFSQVIKIPDSMNHIVGAGFTVGAQTSYSMLRRANIDPNNKVLVTAGASNTSLFLINALLKIDVEIFVITSLRSNSLRLKEMGVKNVLISSELQTSQYANFFDVVLDPFCDLFFFNVFKMIRMEGRYLTCGLYNQLNEDLGNLSLIISNASYKDILVHAISNNISIIGNCLGSTKDLSNALQDFNKGTLKVIIDSIFTKNDLPAFINRTFNDKNKFGKVIYSYLDEWK